MVLVAREYAHERGKDIGHHPCQHACRLWRGFGGRWNEICRVRHCLRGRIVLSIWWRRKFLRWLVTFRGHCSRVSRRRSLCNAFRWHVAGRWSVTLRRHSSLIIWRRSLHHAFRPSESFRRHLPFKSWRRCRAGRRSKTLRWCLTLVAGRWSEPFRRLTLWRHLSARRQVGWYLVFYFLGHFWREAAGGGTGDLGHALASRAVSTRVIKK